VTGEPQHVRLQHILIGFKGTVPGKDITRSQEEAQELAAQLLDRAKKGEDFDALVKKYTDDQYPGVYALANRMVTPGEGEFSRDRMIPAFGDVGFPLQIGEIGMAQYDPGRSPYGWHIIKRIS
jgi:parvulin-like peptidyl-prolyl isomerase